MKSRLLYNPEQIDQILINIIANGENGHHEHYKRTVEVAEYCYKLNTGKYTEDQIVCYRPRETPAQKEQRFKIDFPKTKSFLAKLKSPLDEISRCDGLVSSFEYESDEEGSKKAELKAKLDLYGEGGLQNYLDEEVKRIDCYDANSFIVTEICEDQDGEKFHYPIEVNSPYVWNYSIDKGCLQYLVVRTNAEFENVDSTRATLADTAEQMTNGTATKKDKKKVKKNQYFNTTTTYTIYGPNSAVTYTETPNDAKFKPTELDYANYGEELVTIGDTGRNYLRNSFNYENTNKVPAVRVGFKKDAETGFETCVPFYWDVTFDLDKLINYNNEEVLAIAIHGILKTYNYVEECNHQKRSNNKSIRCVGGYYAGSNDCPEVGTKCSNCKGSGLKIHTTTQDAILLKLPAKDDMIPLNQLVHYAQYPEYALKHLTEKRKEVESEIYNCLYGNNRFERSELVSATATEIKDGKTGTNNTLGRFGANISRLYKELAMISACLTNAAEGLTIAHKYPSDFKLETLPELIAMRKAANESGAPYEVIREIDLAILAKQCKDDKSTLELVKAKEKFLPFRSKSDQERAAIVLSLPEDDPNRVLYCFHDEIIQRAVFENENFSKMPYDEKKQKIDDIVSDIIDKNNQRIEANQSDIPLLVRDASNRNDG